MHLSPTVFLNLTPQATSVDDVRRFISIIETLLLTAPQADVPVTHYFSHNVYAREMKLKAETLLVGRVHLFENLNILSEGEASVFSIDGVKRLKAPATFVGSKGSKRIIFAHTDLTWTTVLGTASRDVDEIERDFTAVDYSRVS